MKKIIFAAAALLALPISASASFHFMHITEVFTNPSGTIQYIELQADAGGQGFVSQAELIAKNATGTVTTTILDITTDFLALDGGETLLFATPAAQTALGFTADYTIPAGSIPITNGRVIYQSDGGSTVVDAVAYGSYSGSNAGFGTPAASLPTDGINSLQRVATTFNNSTDYASAASSPKRNSGTTGAFTAVEDWMMY